MSESLRASHHKDKHFYTLSWLSSHAPSMYFRSKPVDVAAVTTSTYITLTVWKVRSLSGCLGQSSNIYWGVTTPVCVAVMRKSSLQRRNQVAPNSRPDSHPCPPVSSQDTPACLAAVTIPAGSAFPKGSNPHTFHSPSAVGSGRKTGKGKSCSTANKWGAEVDAGVPGSSWAHLSCGSHTM